MVLSTPCYPFPFRKLIGGYPVSRCFGGEGPHAAWFCMVVPGPEEEALAFTHRATVAFAMAPSLLLVFRIEGVDSGVLQVGSESLPRVFAPHPRASGAACLNVPT